MRDIGHLPIKVFSLILEGKNSECENRLLLQAAFSKVLQVGVKRQEAEKEEKTASPKRLLFG